MDAIWTPFVEWLQGFGAQAGQQAAEAGSQVGGQVAALMGGTLAASSQAAKTTTRAAINTSPEPFSNIAMSLVEDGLVVGAVWLATNQPVIFGILLLIALVLMWLVTWMLFKFLRAAFRRLRAWFSPDSVPAH